MDLHVVVGVFFPLVFHIRLNNIFISFPTLLRVGRSTWCDAGNSKSSQFYPPLLWQLTNENNELPLLHTSIALSLSSLPFFSVEPQPICGVRVNMADSKAHDDTTRWKWTLSLPLCLSDTDGALRWRLYTLGETDQKEAKQMWFPYDQCTRHEHFGTLNIFKLGMLYN